MINLPKSSFEVLKKCLNKHNPELISIIENPQISHYSQDFYNELRTIVCDEFIVAGLKEDSEPNEYGLILENLIDEIGRLFMR